MHSGRTEHSYYLLGRLHKRKTDFKKWYVLYGTYSAYVSLCVLVCARMSCNWCPSRRVILVTSRNEVVAKVMFLLVSVILLTGGVSDRENPPGKEAPQARKPHVAGDSSPRRSPPLPHPPRRPPLTPGKETSLTPGRESPLAGRPPGKETPWQGDPLARRPPGRETLPAYGQWAAGTHPTGMHSCWVWIHSDSYVTPIIYLHTSMEGNQSGWFSM